MVLRTGGMNVPKKTALDERGPQRVAGKSIAQQYLENILLERSLRRRRFVTVRFARQRAMFLLQNEQQALEALLKTGGPGVDQLRENVRNAEVNVAQLRALEARFQADDRNMFGVPVPLRPTVVQPPQ